jgi:nucleoside 2-deoxyribosyltransferase
MKSGKKIKSVYVASPLGFSEAGRLFYETVLLPGLKKLGLEIIDPWTLTDGKLIANVADMPFGQEKKDAWEKLNVTIGKNNAGGIERADILVAVLDGVDIDSGTASEIGYACAMGKYIEGYRGDFRLSADNIGSTVNLQVEYFIRSKGGDIAITADALFKNIENKYSTMNE